MNTLDEHPLTVEHTRIVRDVVRYQIAGPIAKDIVCGDVGFPSQMNLNRVSFAPRPMRSIGHRHKTNDHKLPFYRNNTPTRRRYRHFALRCFVSVLPSSALQRRCPSDVSWIFTTCLSKGGCSYRILYQQESSRSCTRQHAIRIRHHRGSLEGDRSYVRVNQGVQDYFKS
ncbi:uncharacterized protein F5147DRAFT_293791 [Suillus discolor]|uniref:Uncharacterized protein n=1 Tax=Suillus discolor TaxID=1912936 RepID=A0A9P7F317_9AGAM|nr:uncharacterized protein F5147DRAFT_293791 [Suillus discolor]KAG2102268.1 hypothetical protein F5147DRAFT_293791 [Suillus discolor]